MQELSKSWSKGCFISRAWKAYAYEISVNTFCTSFRRALFLFIHIDSETLKSMQVLNFDVLKTLSIFTFSVVNSGISSSILVFVSEYLVRYNTDVSFDVLTVMNLEELS